MTARARRIDYNALPDVISIFPLAGALLLPRARLPLNIFEPRYLAMLDDTLRADHRLIGMVQPRDDDPTPALYHIGCAGRVTSFTETEDGRYLIALSGVARFRIEREIEGFTPYRRAQADWRPFRADLDPPPRAVSDDERAEFQDLLRRYFAAAGLSADWEALSRADDETLVNGLAMMCPFSAREKQALLESPGLAERKRDLRALMRFAVAAPGAADGELQ